MSQFRWMLGWIRRRYDQGGYLPPGPTTVRNDTAADERLARPDELLP